jgi:hypothetical protein
MNSKHPGIVISMVFASLTMLPACTYSLMHDNPTAPPNVISHCEGQQNVDDSSVAVIPIPAVAFISPHTELHPVEADQYVDQCGPSNQLANRDVTIDKANCIPASVTEILTLGIFQWCPAVVSYKADVMGPAPQTRVGTRTDTNVVTNSSSMRSIQ